MRIGGFQKLTLVDYPGLVAATVFTQGCNFRCCYCHNPELVLPSFFQTPIPVEVVLEHLRSRKGKLEGVVITGGEPTLQEGLADLIVRIKEMGFKVKIDTNGSHPEILSSLIELKLLDYIAMDIKTSLEKYPQVTGVSWETEKIQESIRIIINSGVAHQFRTTLVEKFCSQQDLMEIKELIDKDSPYVLQPFVRKEKLVGELERVL